MAQTANNQKVWRIFTIVLSSLIIAACIWFICSRLTDRTDVKTVDTTFSVAANNGADMKIVMIDGSQIWIRNGSRVEYSSAFGADRTVTLTGSAFFNVANSTQNGFRTMVGNLTVETYEAEYQVVADLTQRQITIVLNSGTMWILASDGSTRNLSQGERLVFNEETNEISIENLPSGKLNEWRSEKLNFSLMTLAEIFDSLSGLYNIPFEFDRAQMGGDRFSIKLDGTEKLDEIMQIVAIISGRFSFVVDQGERVRIFSNK